MGEEFDPYDGWLGIPPDEQPPDHYRLLGIERFEPDPEVIRAAAEQRVAYLRTFQLSRYVDFSEGLLNQVAAARVCLLDPEKKAEYDLRLRSQSRPVPPEPSAGAPAVTPPLVATGPAAPAATQPPPLPATVPAASVGAAPVLPGERLLEASTPDRRGEELLRSAVKALLLPLRWIDRLLAVIAGGQENTIVHGFLHRVAVVVAVAGVTLLVGLTAKIASTPRDTPIAEVTERRVPPEPAAPPAKEPEPPEPTPPPKAEPEPQDPIPKPKSKTLQVPASSATPFGRLVSERVVLARFEPKESEWQRVPAQGSVSANRQLLALPTYRPMIALRAAVTLQLMGGTQIELLPADDTGVPGLTIVYGQVVMQTVGKAGTQMRIQAGQQAGLLTFADPESKVAIAVSRTHVPAADPETQPDPVKVELYATSGRIGWTPAGGGPPIVVDSIGLLTLSGQPTQAAPVDKLPAWVNSDTTSPLDRRASGTMELALTVDRPVRVGLKEMADHRQREVRWLAVRCLGCLGDFRMVVAALNNPDERLLWPEYINHLQEALLRGPQAAAAVRQTMENQFGQNGPALYRMLCGYTDEGLNAGDAAKLVDYLEHPGLAFRVLSFWNLRTIFRWGLYYQPEAPEARRKQSVQRWRERLESGALSRRR